MLWALPVDPDAETAREWLEQELSKPEYRESGMGWLDRITEWLNNFLEQLFNPGSGNGIFGSVGVIVIIAIVVVLVAVLLFVFLGPLRPKRRARPTRAVFEDDERVATDIRAAALAAAANKDWTLAVIERFRALVRSVEERNLVLVVPGMTAWEFTSEVGARLEEHQVSLESCADLFDAIRYGHAVANREAYEFISATDDAVALARPKALV